MSEEHPTDDPMNSPAPEPDAPATPPDMASSGSPSGGSPSSDERNMAMLAHILGIFTGFLGALIIWLIKKDTSPFVDDQGKEALNFQITVFIASAVASVSIFIVIGCVLMPLVLVADIVLCIMAGVAASKGERYRYPFAIRLLT